MSDISGTIVLDMNVLTGLMPPPENGHPDAAVATTAPTNGPLRSSPPSRRSSLGMPATENHINSMLQAYQAEIQDLRFQLSRNTMNNYGNRPYDSRATSSGIYMNKNGQVTRPNTVTMAYVKTFMNDEYSDAGFNMSTSMDILAVYIKAQKLLYTEAKVYCEQQLNMLMLPAICVSALCTLLSLALQNQFSGPYIISSLTAINSFILALISYLKLDAKAEAHKTSAYNYNRLLTICEFESGKIMFFRKDNNKNDKSDNEHEHVENGNNDNNLQIDWYTQMLNLVSEVEKRIGEIQDTNKFMLPQYIRYNFRTLNEQNLFSKVKNLQLTELNLLNDLKISLRKFREKEYPFLNDTKTAHDLAKLSETADTDPKKQELIEATTNKEHAMRRVINHRKEYLTLEDEFNKEIDDFINKAKGRSCGCNWLKT